MKTRQRSTCSIASESLWIHTFSWQGGPLFLLAYGVKTSARSICDLTTPSLSSCRHHYDFLMESAINAINATSPPSSETAEKVRGSHKQGGAANNTPQLGICNLSIGVLALCPQVSRPVPASTMVLFIACCAAWGIHVAAGQNGGGGHPQASSAGPPPPRAARQRGANATGCTTRQGTAFTQLALHFPAP